MGDVPRLLAAHAYSAANWLALHARRHMHLYGTTKEQLGWLALNSRRNAALNPRAAYRDPLTMDDYLSARMISEPFGLLDCDVPVDGSVAFVVSTADAAADCDHSDPGGGLRGLVGLGRLGPAGRLSQDGVDRRRGRDVESHRSEAWTTSTSRSCTTASPSSPSPGSRPSGSAAMARRGRSSRVVHASPSTGSFRSTPTAASSRRAACTATGSSTRPACSCAARRGRARFRSREVAVASNGGGPIAGCILLTR